MSDGILKEKREKHRKIPFFPVAAEIVLIFIFLIFLGGLAMHFSLREELTKYETGMYHMSMEQILEAEAGQFLVLAAKAGTGQIDMKQLEKDRNSDSISQDISFSGDLNFGYSRWEKNSRKNNIYLRYVFSDGGEKLTELDVASGTTAPVDPESEFGKALADAVRSKKPEEVDIGTGTGTMRMRMLPMKLFSPVMYGDRQLSQGGRNGVAVICAYFFEESQIGNSRRRSLTVSLIAFSGLILSAVVMSFLIWHSLRVFKPIQASMEAIRRGEAEKAEEEGKKINELTTAPEVRELQENVRLMFLNIREYGENVNSITKEFEPVLPGALLKLFGREDIRDIVPGDEAVLDGISVYIGLEDEPEQENIPFREKNRLLGSGADAVSLLGGIVTAIGARHIRAVFPEAVKGKMRELAEILQGLDLKGTGVRRIRISMKEGRSVLTVIGVPERMAIRQDQETADTLAGMDRMQETFRLEPLFTGAGTENLKVYRELWPLPGGKGIFELLEGKSSAAERKRASMTEWNKAMELFRREDFHGAMKLFGAVLRADRNDGAAGYLLEECENRL